MQKLNVMMVKSGGWIYREMTSVFLFSAISSLVLVPLVFFFSAWTALVLLPLLYAPLVAGVYHAVNRMVSGEKPKLKNVFTGAVRYFVPSAIFGLLCSFFVLILVSTWWYYGQQAGMWNWMLAIFQTYFVAMFFVSQIYTLPLIVQEKESAFRAIGRSLKLTVIHPAYTIGAGFQLLCVTVVLALTVVGFACLFAGTAAVFANLLTRNVLAGPEQSDERLEDDKAFGGVRG